MTRWKSTLTHTSLAALMVGAVAAAPFVATGEAEAGAEARFADARTADRTLDARSGPFFGLRVNSFDVNGDVRVLGCFRYRCPAIDRDGMPDRYHVVRSALFDDDVDVTNCDEVLKRTFGGADVSFSALVFSTRWIRDVGPNGVTPVGGFVARMDIDATVDLGPIGEFTFGMLDYGILGTQGLRPRRGDPTTVADPGETTRCDAPFHDEGYFQASVDRAGVRRLISTFGGNSLVVKRLKRLNKSIITGTFEGHTHIANDAANPYDFCRLDELAWWFDGLVGYVCRPPEPAVDETPTDPVDPLPVDEQLTRK